MIRGLAHVCFTVSDLKRAEAFYGGALGLKVAFEFLNNEGRRTGLYLKAGPRCFIELFEGKPVAAPQGISFRHICLEVSDINAVVRDLRQRGIKVGDVSLGKDQSYQAWLSDPDGNAIELHHYTPQSWQAPHLD